MVLCFSIQCISYHLYLAGTCQSLANEMVPWYTVCLVVVVVLCRCIFNRIVSAAHGQN